MAVLPYFQSSIQALSMMQTQWKSKLDPILANPINATSILESIPLKVGVNVINHLLGQVQQGWYISDINGIATIYRSAPFNDKTLTLTSSAAVTVNINVF
jgi:hypothetical protein